MYVMCWLIKWGDHAIVSWCLDGSCPLSRYHGINGCNSFHDQIACNHCSSNILGDRFSMRFMNRCNQFCVPQFLQLLVFSIICLLTGASRFDYLLLSPSFHIHCEGVWASWLSWLLPIIRRKTREPIRRGKVILFVFGCVKRFNSAGIGGLT